MSVVPTNQHYILLVSQNEKCNLPWILELFWSLSSVTKWLISDGPTSLIVPYWLKTGSLDPFPLLQTNKSHKIHDMTTFGHVVSAFLSKRSGVFDALTTTTIINPNNVKSVQTMNKKITSNRKLAATLLNNDLGSARMATLAFVSKIIIDRLCWDPPEKETN